MFQSPEGDSLFFYLGHRATPGYRATPERFSPPKGIRCFSTWSCLENGRPRARTWRTLLGFSPPKGIRCFSTRRLTVRPHVGQPCFSPPKGIHCFSTWHRLLWRWPIQYVSVPRRGFVVFLRGQFRGYVGRGGTRVSVPRRGFIVFLLDEMSPSIPVAFEFQSPEGDSLFFYRNVQEDS